MINTSSVWNDSALRYHWQWHCTTVIKRTITTGQISINFGASDLKHWPFPALRGGRCCPARTGGWNLQCNRLSSPHKENPPSISGSHNRTPTWRTTRSVNAPGAVTVTDRRFVLNRIRFTARTYAIITTFICDRVVCSSPVSCGHICQSSPLQRLLWTFSIKRNCPTHWTS